MIKNIFNLYLVAIVLFFVQCRKSASEDFVYIYEGVDLTHYTIYYVDSENGDDSNDGLSPEKPWKTLVKTFGRTWEGGEAILLKRGSVFQETFYEPKGSGDYNLPIVLSSYGDVNMPLPKIVGVPNSSKNIMLFTNNSYWEISNLHITNTHYTQKSELVGIRVNAKNGKVVNHFHIKNCIISDINGFTSREGGGIAITFNNQEKTGSYFDGLLIENNKIYNVTRDAIKSFSGIPTGVTSAKLNKNVVIKNNVIENVPGDGIVVDGCDGALIEDNIIRYGYTLGPGKKSDGTQVQNPAAGIWPIRSKNTIIRKNIVQDFDAMTDGQAFDTDEDNQNTLFEYNISYNNAGGFMLLCPTPTTEHNNTIIRYNVSINDGGRKFSSTPDPLEYKQSPLIWTLGKVQNVYIYNNTFINTNDTDYNHAFFFSPSYKSNPNTLYIANNIFYTNVSKNNNLWHWASVKPTENSDIVFRNNYVQGYENNASFGTVGSDFNRDNIYESPLKAHPFNSLGDFGRTINRQRIRQSLILKSDYVGFDKGLNILELENIFPVLKLFPVTTDFWGNYIGYSKNIGAYNH